MGELIEDLLGTSLASLFAWDIIWIPLLTVVVLFLLAGGIPGKLFSRIPVTQVFRHYTDGKRGWMPNRVVTKRRRIKIKL